MSPRISGGIRFDSRSFCSRGCTNAVCTFVTGSALGAGCRLLSAAGCALSSGRLDNACAVDVKFLKAICSSIVVAVHGLVPRPLSLVRWGRGTAYTRYRHITPLRFEPSTDGFAHGRLLGSHGWEWVSLLSHHALYQCLFHNLLLSEIDLFQFWEIHQ